MNTHRPAGWLAVTLLGGMVWGTAATAQEPITGRWDGGILIMGQELRITVAFQPGDTAWSATIDVPQQGARGLPLEGVAYEPPAVRFELAAGPGRRAVFDGTVAGDSMGGTFTQSGATGSFWLKRSGAAAPEAPEATEDTTPPPYQEEEVTFANGDVSLAGTLTVPAGRGPHPAVVLISGSGPQNRDEELLGMKPFRLLADHLTRRGIAVLRYDDRGVGGSTGNVAESTTEDFVGDVLAAVALLRARSDIAEDAVGLLGHSEGGIVAPLAANRSDHVAFVVLLAGTAVPGDSIIYSQSRLIARANGETEEGIAKQRAFQGRFFRAIRADSGWQAVREELEQMTRDGLAQLPPERRRAITDEDQYVASTVQTRLEQGRSRWLRFFLDYDPAPALRQLEVPVLALFGEKDLQVPPAINEEPMAHALQAGGNPDYTIRVIPGANHLFQRAETGSPAEYAKLDKTFVPGLLERITAWILQRTNGEPAPPGR